MCYQKMQFACGHDGSIANGDRVFVRKSGIEHLIESPSINGASKARTVPSIRFAKDLCSSPKTCTEKNTVQKGHLQVPCRNCYTKQSEHEAYKKFAKSCEDIEPSAQRLEFSHPDRKPQLKLSEMTKVTVGLFKRSATKATSASRIWRDKIKYPPMKGYARTGGQEPMMMLPLKKGQPARQAQGSSKP